MNDPISAESHLRYILQSDEAQFVHLARLHLARLYLDSQRLEEAERLLNAARADHPEDPTVLGLCHPHRRTVIDAAQE